MQRFMVGAVLVAMAACGSERVQARPSGGSTETNDAFNNRMQLTRSLMQCARLTYASTEKPLEMKLALDAYGLPAALSVGPPGTSLMCPADDPNSPVIMKRGNGGSFGKMPATAWMVEVWCTQGFQEGSEGGCASDAHYEGRDTRVAAAKVPETPTSLKSGKRAERALHYQSRRLGVDFPEGTTLRVEDQAKALDAVVDLCLHSRQPDVNISGNSNFTLNLLLATGPMAVGAPYLVEGGSPQALVDSIFPCLRMLTPTEVAEAVPIKVRYSLVAEETGKAPGDYVQRWELNVLKELVEAGVPSVPRREFVNALSKQLLRCMAARPLEVRGATSRWVSLPPLVFTGTVDAVKRDKIHLLSLTVTGPPALEWQAQCVVDALPLEQGNTPANAQWQVVVDVAPLEALGH